MLNYKSLTKILVEMGYPFTLHSHDPLFTVKDSINKRGEIRGSHAKNLFLKNKKNSFFLFSCSESKKLDLKKISKNLNIGNISFANEEYLLNYLGVSPGSVTPFGLLNDTEQSVAFYLDKDFLSKDTVNFHPLTNSFTLNIRIDDFINFFIENKKKINIFDFTRYEVIETR